MKNMQTVSEGVYTFPNEMLLNILEILHLNPESSSSRIDKKSEALIDATKKVHDLATGKAKHTRDSIKELSHLLYSSEIYNVKNDWEEYAVKVLEAGFRLATYELEMDDRSDPQHSHQARTINLLTVAHECTARADIYETERDEEHSSISHTAFYTGIDTKSAEDQKDILNWVEDEECKSTPTWYAKGRTNTECFKVTRTGHNGDFFLVLIKEDSNFPLKIAQKLNTYNFKTLKAAKTAALEFCKQE